MEKIYPKMYPSSDRIELCNEPSKFSNLFEISEIGKTKEDALEKIINAIYKKQYIKSSIIEIPKRIIK